MNIMTDQEKSRTLSSAKKKKGSKTILSDFNNIPLEALHNAEISQLVTAELQQHGAQMKEGAVMGLNAVSRSLRFSAALGLVLLADAQPSLTTRGLLLLGRSRGVPVFRVEGLRPLLRAAFGFESMAVGLSKGSTQWATVLSAAESRVAEAPTSMEVVPADEPEESAQNAPKEAKAKMDWLIDTTGSTDPRQYRQPKLSRFPSNPQRRKKQPKRNH